MHVGPLARLFNITQLLLQAAPWTPSFSTKISSRLLAQSCSTHAQGIERDPLGGQDGLQHPHPAHSNPSPRCCFVWTSTDCAGCELPSARPEPSACLRRQGGLPGNQLELPHYHGHVPSPFATGPAQRGRPSGSVRVFAWAHVLKLTPGFCKYSWRALAASPTAPSADLRLTLLPPLHHPLSAAAHVGHCRLSISA